MSELCKISRVLQDKKIYDKKGNELRLFLIYDLLNNDFIYELSNKQKGFIQYKIIDNNLCYITYGSKNINKCTLYHILTPNDNYNEDGIMYLFEINDTYYVINKLEFEKFLKENGLIEIKRLEI